MKKINPKLIGKGKTLSSFAIAIYILLGGAFNTAFAQESEVVSFDGLERIESSDVAVAYIKPGVDFSVFERVAILDPYVAFRDNWQRDQNRSRRRNIRSSDMDRIKADVASLFKEVFTEQLEADDGFEVVDVANVDVLLLRPAIIDLDVTSPDISSAGRSRTYAVAAGAATLYIQLIDSLTGEVIGRAVDRQATRRAGGMISWNNRVTNMAEGRRLMRPWADTLREFLDQHYSIVDSEASE
jgi:hypothetical protein